MEQCNCNHGRIVVALPDWVDPDKQVRSVSIDECIVTAIKDLWENHVETRGYC